MLPDPAAERGGDLRVIDESGEDYLFAADRFVAIEVPSAVGPSMRQARDTSKPSRPRSKGLREGWEEAFKRMDEAGDDELLLPDHMSAESDRTEWVWDGDLIEPQPGVATLRKGKAASAAKEDPLALRELLNSTTASKASRRPM